MASTYFLRSSGEAADTLRYRSRDVQSTDGFGLYLLAAVEVQFGSKGHWVRTTANNGNNETRMFKRCMIYCFIHSYVIGIFLQGSFFHK